MKSFLTLFFSLFLISCADCTEEQFVDLFNGKDFTNWGGEGETEKFGYVVVDGVIESTPKCRFLITDKEYTNYVLHFEFQLTPGANNGLGIHYPGKGDAAYAGMEIQILDNTHPKYAKLKDYQFHGGLYTLKAAKKGHLKPVGEWNQEIVTINGSKVKVELNGVIIMEADLDEINKAHPKHKGAKRRKGHLAFCGHGDIIRLRNLKIKELP
ncbi:MAG: 3-keto-disaccharide hydrolase [Akkermansiaceae bacterium]